MANIELLNVASSTIIVNGDPVKMDGGQSSISISATSYGGDGIVTLLVSADGIKFTNLPDASTGNGLAQYSADTIININRLPMGWSIKANLVVTSGTVTSLVVIMGT